MKCSQDNIWNEVCVAKDDTFDLRDPNECVVLLHHVNRHK